MRLIIGKGDKLLAGIVLDGTIAGLVSDVPSEAAGLVGEFAYVMPVPEPSAVGFNFDTNVEKRMIFSAQDHIFGWLSFRFKRRLLERIL